MRRPLYPLGKSRPYPLGRRLDGSLSRSRRGGQEKLSLRLPGTDPGGPDRNLITILTELSRL